MDNFCFFFFLMYSSIFLLRGRGGQIITACMLISISQAAAAVALIFLHFGKPASVRATAEKSTAVWSHHVSHNLLCDICKKCCVGGRKLISFTFC